MSTLTEIGKSIKQQIIKETGANIDLTIDSFLSGEMDLVVCVYDLPLIKAVRALLDKVPNLSFLEETTEKEGDKEFCFLIYSL